MSISHTHNPFKNTAEVTSFVAGLGSLLEQKNCDFRTLSQTKRLHVISELLDHQNWQKFSAHLVKSEFVDTLMNIYGLSEQYADAAWTTLSDKSGSGKIHAENYCNRFKIEPKPAIDELPDDLEKLYRWLHMNSAGNYRPSAEAAEVMKLLYEKVKRLEHQIESMKNTDK